MGDPTINAYPRFESVPHTLLASTSTLVGRRLTAATASQGAFQAALQDPTLINVSMTQVGSAAPKNVLIARSAVAPHDVVIEAAVYAEEGSFFVIPGPWYNTNADDNRGDFEAGVGAYSGLATPVEKNLRRYTRFGHAPQVPFFQEPLAVRVRIRGAISENLPAPMSQQAEWKRKWGWIPRTIGSTGVQVPQQWVPFGFDPAVPGTVLPNFSVTFDPALALGSAGGVSLRRDEYGRNLPPMPRMPVSPTLAYVGDPNS
jgi:hypothetical protein